MLSHNPAIILHYQIKVLPQAPTMNQLLFLCHLHAPFMSFLATNAMSRTSVVNKTVYMASQLIALLTFVQASFQYQHD